MARQQSLSASAIINGHCSVPFQPRWDGRARAGDPESPAEFTQPGDINLTPRPSLSFLNLFSGPYKRPDGLSAVMSTFGWDNILNIDNDQELCGGWDDDILNDSHFTELKSMGAAGAWDSMVIQYRCVTTTIG